MLIQSLHCQSWLILLLDGLIMQVHYNITQFVSLRGIQLMARHFAYLLLSSRQWEEIWPLHYNLLLLLGLELLLLIE